MVNANRTCGSWYANVQLSRRQTTQRKERRKSESIVLLGASGGYDGLYADGREEFVEMRSTQQISLIVCVP
jgi:hypothetical protein